MDTFNVENVMDEIRSKILEEGVVADALDFDDVPMPDDLEIPEGDRKSDEIRFRKEMYYLRTHWKVPMDVGVRSHNRWIEFIKTTLKKLTNFQIFPINAAQNDINASAAKCIYYLNRQLQAKEEEIHALTCRIETLEKMSNERGDVHS
jgi:hypothetical protein